MQTAQVEPKVTAEQIKTDCPEPLRQIGEEVRARLEKIDKDEAVAKRVADHGIAVKELLASAKKLCDDAGFKKFLEIYCPQLGKSQRYAWLAVLTGKKTLLEHRAGELDRKRRTRARQKAAAENSGTEAVPERSVSATEPDDAPAATTGDAISAQSDHMEMPKRSSSKSAPDSGLKEFNNHATRLLQMIKAGAKPHRFVKTPIAPDDLTKLSALFADVAKLKSKSKPHYVPQGSAEISPEDRKAQHAALEETEDRKAA